MVREIATKVLNTVRDITIKNKTEIENSQIRVVSTFKADQSLIKSVRNSEESFKQTPSFRNIRGSLFSFVKKIGPSIKSGINNLKKQALGTIVGGVKKCNGPGCKCCKMLCCTL